MALVMTGGAMFSHGQGQQAQRAWEREMEVRWGFAVDPASFQV